MNSSSHSTPLAGRPGASSIPRGEPAVDWFDRKIVHFVLLWGQFGTLRDEDVYPEFGMRAEQLYGRFNRIIALLRTSEYCLDSGDRELLSRARRHEADRHRHRPAINQRTT